MLENKKKFFVFLNTVIIFVLLLSFSFEYFSTILALDNHTYNPSPPSLNTNQKWTPVEVVSTESGASSYKPSITADKEGNIYIVWEDLTNILGAGSDNDVFYKMRNSSTSTWTTTEYISTEAATDGGSFIPEVAVDSIGNVHVAWAGVEIAGTLNDREIFYKRWDSSTETWTTTELVSEECTYYSGLAKIAIDSQDNIHIVWEDETDIFDSGIDMDIFYRFLNTTDYTWSEIVLLSTESTGQSRNPRIAADCFGNIHVAWDDYTDILSAGVDRDIFYRSWNRNIANWTTTELVTIQSNDQSNLGDITADLAGKVHIVWEDLYTFDSNDGSDSDIFYKSKDSCSWSNLEFISRELNGESYEPKIAVDNSGNINIIWRDLTDYANSGTDQDIFFKRWDATYSSWTPIVILSEESTDISRCPDISTDPFGNIHVVWEDFTELYGSDGDCDLFYRIYAFPPGAPNLAFIVPNPTDLSSVSLVWEEVKSTSMYHIYRSNTYIWSIQGLSPITSVTTTYVTDTLPAEGIYYYVVVAENLVGNSSLSNCRYIEYKLPTLQEYFLITGIVTSAIIFSIIGFRVKRKKDLEH